MMRCYEYFTLSPLTYYSNGLWFSSQYRNTNTIYITLTCFLNNIFMWSILFRMLFIVYPTYCFVLYCLQRYLDVCLCFLFVACFSHVVHTCCALELQVKRIQVIINIASYPFSANPWLLPPLLWLRVIEDVIFFDVDVWYNIWNMHCKTFIGNM